ncbi:hypothetical protein DCAR_0935658 [Daucus carota subsp. sativus]|uniref:Uncharacterized protein n=1 Tax=Daucus carota subsp. sativus TaxID=79200 RepID=A0A175YIZ3_DAUCS|nr:PREDICTED: early light-induced protein 1, chloroplastic-like [Daucus carota subsp. sativus]WOH16109.1 hypothetical protein DCAR_0935658 [Daucus carota subsp. sativus]
MATSTVMQSILASPASTAITGRRVNLVPANYAPSLSRSAYSLRTRCMAKDGRKEESSPPPTPKASTSFFDVLAFSGPAPERINGRLAMIGFVAAMAVEVSNGQDVFSQISNGGVPWFLGTSVLLTLASLVPLFKGVSVETKSGGLMTSDAEMWNGRFAMLGLVALALTEYIKGSALV